MMLHEGVTFHGGEDFSAEDVKWTIDYVINPDTKSPNATFLSQVDSVEVLDPLTIRFNLNRPWAAMPADLSTIQIYSKTSTKESIETTPNGTGPFMWTEWVPGDHITLTKNPDYFIPDRPYPRRDRLPPDQGEGHEPLGDGSGRRRRLLHPGGEGEGNDRGQSDV